MTSFSLPYGAQLDLDQMLARSEQMQEHIFGLLGEQGFHGAPRSQVATGMCFVALEHAEGLRALMELALASSAVALMRLQFEALTRAAWLLYAAPESAIGKLLAPLTVESEKAAKNLPSVNEMMEDLRKSMGNPGEGISVGAYQMLAHFKDMTWSAMNSFVHGGLHPLRRVEEGFPPPLALQILRNSNGLVTMTGMLLAILTGDSLIASAMSRIQPDFADCLPDLQERGPGA
ncbi:DUF6988 family protein [Xanthomonas phaseoli]|uniref:DUF6988 family protein n=1 Tax=Xanthomonas phaseoli TaxID=1985254 RepID=UPI001E5D5F5A|nr:hypothetical protein [Xanthomonas phaseoli]MCC8470215.1 hypothetical protein [Xanthomonas phaseoli]